MGGHLNEEAPSRFMPCSCYVPPSNVLMAKLMGPSSFHGRSGFRHEAGTSNGWNIFGQYKYCKCFGRHLVTFSTPHYTVLSQYRIIQVLAKVGYNNY